MAINGVGGSSVSWAQFVTATQAARQRNSGLTVNATGNYNPAVTTAKAVNTAAQKINPNPVISPKAAHNVYSVYGQINKRQEISAEPTGRPVGGNFDAYA